MSTLLRQLAFLAPEDWENRRVHIIGCGGLGSTAAIILAKMGCPEMHLYDMDTVDDVNIANQFFKPSNIGMPKVAALANNVTDYAGSEGLVYCHQGKIQDTMEIQDLEDEDIIILALDSNDVRRWFYEQVIATYPPWKKLYIFDTRMGGLTFDVYFSTNENAQEALDDTPKDEDVPDDLCTAKAIAFNVFGCSSFLAAWIRKHLKREDLQDERKHIQVCMQNDIIANQL